MEIGDWDQICDVSRNVTRMPYWDMTHGESCLDTLHETRHMTYWDMTRHKVMIRWFVATYMTRHEWPWLSHVSICASYMSVSCLMSRYVPHAWLVMSDHDSFVMCVTCMNRVMSQYVICVTCLMWRIETWLAMSHVSIRHTCDVSRYVTYFSWIESCLNMTFTRSRLVNDILRHDSMTRDMSRYVTSHLCRVKTWRITYRDVTHLHMCVTCLIWLMTSHGDMSQYVIFVCNISQDVIRVCNISHMTNESWLICHTHGTRVMSPYTIHIWYVNISFTYGVATISRLLKIIGLFCRISSLL